MKWKLKNSTQLLFVFTLFLAVADAAFFIYQSQVGLDLDWRSNVTHKEVPKNQRLLDGELVALDKMNFKPVAVVIENHKDSRPASGLEQASIIYEIVVEGDITRFLAIFDPSFSIKKIGPVRSVRPFFVDLAKEWDVVLFHSGGSSQALNELKTSRVIDIDEISANGIYFWRDAGRQPPHNLYTSASQINRAITAKEINLEGDFLPWEFKDDSPIKTPDVVNEISIPFLGNDDYRVSYQYSSSTNQYLRYLAGKPHKTQPGKILKANNIIIQYVEYSIVDDYGRLDVDLNGGGAAQVYQDGKRIDGQWRKINGKTQFYNEDGKAIAFNRGVTWVELVFN